MTSTGFAGRQVIANGCRQVRQVIKAFTSRWNCIHVNFSIWIFSVNFWIQLNCKLFFLEFIWFFFMKIKWKLFSWNPGAKPEVKLDFKRSMSLKEFCYNTLPLIGSWNRWNGDTRPFSRPTLAASSSYSFRKDTQSMAEYIQSTAIEIFKLIGFKKLTGNL